MDVLAAQVGGAAQIARHDAGDGGILHRRRSCAGDHRGGGQLGLVRARFRYLFQSVQAADAGRARDDAQATRRSVRDDGARDGGGRVANSAAQVALAVSGIAGPDGGTADKPVGTVWFAWGIKHGETHAQRHQLGGNRAEVRALAVHIALQGLIAANQLAESID